MWCLIQKLILDLVKEYSTTWTKIDAYDKDELTKIGTTKMKIKYAGEELVQAISELKKELIKKSEATDIFSIEREAGSVAGKVLNHNACFTLW
jgi:hypothetical protein